MAAPGQIPTREEHDDDDDDYKSSEDEDFNPNTAQDDVDLSTSDDTEAEQDSVTKPKAKRRKIQASAKDAAELDFENSGDEATIKKGQKKLKRRQGKDVADDFAEEEGGEGGLVKTRAQRAKEKEDRKPLVNTASATVDVDALWASMTAPSPGTQPTPTTSNNLQATSGSPLPKTQSPSADATVRAAGGGVPADSPQAIADTEDTIVIKRTYDFAGETITEEKNVPRFSAEARLYLESQQQQHQLQQNSPSLSSKQPPLRRPKKRVSMFDPNPNGVISSTTPTSQTSTKGPKLNTIEKSKLDWAGFVDREGIKDELDVHSKAKEGYLGRMDFLGRVEAKREEEAKKARQT